MLGNGSQGFALVTDWTTKIIAESVHTQFALQSIYGDKKYVEGNKEEAAWLYEAALKTVGMHPISSLCSI